MRYRLALSAVILQVLALAYLAGEREWILRTGRTVLLRTAPIDPNDPMRGDYVRLDYDISHVPRTRCEGDLPKYFAETTDGRRSRDRRVYARLQLGDDRIAEITALSDAKPSDGLFVRGYAQSSYGPTVQVRYGIEALFMQQGTARKLENMRLNERAGVPLDIEVALSPSGVAVLKNYQWKPLGITVTFERADAPLRSEENVPVPRRRRQVITGLNVELKNHGTGDVAIVDLPAGGSLRLVPDERWQDARYRWVGDSATMPPPTAATVLVLKPGQSHQIKVDLTRPEWFVVSAPATGDKKPMALRDIPDAGSASFRFEYAPPPKSSVSNLPHAELIRHGRLRTGAFNATAGLD